MDSFGKQDNAKTQHLESKIEQMVNDQKKKQKQGNIFLILLHFCFFSEFDEALDRLQREINALTKENEELKERAKMQSKMKLLQVGNYFEHFYVLIQFSGHLHNSQTFHCPNFSYFLNLCARDHKKIFSELKNEAFLYSIRSTSSSNIMIHYKNVFIYLICLAEPAIVDRAPRESVSVRLSILSSVGLCPVPARQSDWFCHCRVPSPAKTRRESAGSRTGSARDSQAEGTNL